MEKRKPQVTLLGGTPLALTSSPKRPVRIGLALLGSEPETLCFVVSTALDDAEISTAQEPGTRRLITAVLPGPTPDTVDVVETTFVLVSSGIYFEPKEISERRRTVPAGSVRVIEVTDTFLFDLETALARFDAVPIIGPRLALLNDEDAPADHREIQLDLGDGVNRYGIPDDLSVEEKDALGALLLIEKADQFVMEGGAVRGVMRGMSLASTLEQLRTRRHEPAVRHSQKIKANLPATRDARSAKSADHKQWARTVFSDYLSAADGSRKVASNKMVEAFKERFPNGKAPAARTILVWVADKQRNRAK